MRATDKMLADYVVELEDHQKFIDGVVEAAQAENRDLDPKELELAERRRTRMNDINERMKPLEESRRISTESVERIAELAKFIGERPNEPAKAFEYRSAGQYILDYWKGSLGSQDAMQRLELFNRAASHQTTSDNPGLLPTPIVEPVINFIDTARPMTTWLGPRQIPSNSWTRPKVTQHTSVAAQPTGEKNELVSQKMTITKTAVTANTYGGYVNVSRQDIDWSTPSIMDLVITDLAAQYGIVTETALGTALVAGATAGSTIPTGTPTVTALTGALWAAAASVYTTTKGQGRLAFFISPDMLGLWGQLFAPVNPITAQSAGFEAANFGSGLMGAISGIPVYMSAGLAAGSNLVVSSAAVEVYEDRIGSLQVVEPSVLGVQIAYAGYYTWWIAAAGGVVSIVKTP